MSRVTLPNPKCSACGRVVATHAYGCSLIACPHRKPQMWAPAEGPQGVHGSLAEDRINPTPGTSPEERER